MHQLYGNGVMNNSLDTEKLAFGSHAIAHFLKRSLINVLCSLPLGDAWLMRFVGIVAVRNKPLAHQHLEHYLKGNGRALALDSDRLFADDSGVRDEFLSQVAERIRWGERSGTIGIPQSAFATREWLFALGGISIPWFTDGYWVSARPGSQYDWHPDQPRITQGIHRLAIRLKDKGASEFSIQGSVLSIPITAVKNAGPPKAHDRSVLNLL